MQVLEPFSFSFFHITGLEKTWITVIIEWFALEMNRDHSFVFETIPKYCILDSLLTMREQKGNQMNIHVFFKERYFIILNFPFSLNNRQIFSWFSYRVFGALNTEILEA